jgi:Zn-dependent M28 family amino/carboxypeptidase
LIVIGAHYDVCGEQEGADDNASGVTAILELARLFSRSNLTRPIELVAYTLEEPPFFGTQSMGSYITEKIEYSRLWDGGCRNDRILQ